MTNPIQIHCMSSTGDGLTPPVSGFVLPSLAPAPRLSSRLGSPASQLVWHDNLSYSPAGVAVNPVTGSHVLLKQGPPRRLRRISRMHYRTLLPHQLLFLFPRVVQRMHRRCHPWRRTLLRHKLLFLLLRPPCLPVLAPPLPCWCLCYLVRCGQQPSTLAAVRWTCCHMECGLLAHAQMRWPPHVYGFPLYSY